jgi:hypothetical protein
MNPNDPRTVIWTAGGESHETDTYCSEACEQEALSGLTILERDVPIRADLIAAGYGCAFCRCTIPCAS